MKQRKFTNGITFFTTPIMYDKLKEITDERDVGISEFLRSLIGEYLTSCPESELCQHDCLIPAPSKGDRDGELKYKK